MKEAGGLAAALCGHAGFYVGKVRAPAFERAIGLTSRPARQWPRPTIFRRAGRPALSIARQNRRPWPSRPSRGEACQSVRPVGFPSP
ncbi:hypothetical protein CHELA1G11_10088 [Hyphomicrobiales bacterium]|nr:hypothetical protein CHELA1G11_10088 [Hyphomicrobiales bacterium]CAH1677162.1 hypothetical protein CHELA1G2_14222 [Hyphomicrobiales bacterium]